MQHPINFRFRLNSDGLYKYIFVSFFEAVVVVLEALYSQGYVWEGVVHK